MDAETAQHAQRVVEGWEAYGMGHGSVVPLYGDWYGKGGCFTRILDLKQSILHVDARIDSESGGILFKDGPIPYGKLEKILESVSEDGKQVQLLVLMVTHSADRGQAEGLSHVSDCILAVRGEASPQSRDHLQTLYENLRTGRTLKHSLTILTGATQEHNLVLLPSRAQQANCCYIVT
eukprot:3634776-Rhodomonas_salina.1